MTPISISLIKEEEEEEEEEEEIKEKKKERRRYFLHMKETSLTFFYSTVSVLPLSFPVNVFVCLWYKS